MIQKNYANLSLGQSHYRRAGSGPKLVLLHPSPLSSIFMEPIITCLRAHVDAIAPDTPGYGNSDPLPAPVLQADNSLAPYVAWLDEFVDHLGLEPFVLYGSATGAQVAIEFAKAYPHKVRHLILENAAHFESSEVQGFQREYFPSLATREDGGHFMQAWQIASALFQWFPWYAQDEAHRIGDAAKLPTAVIHATAMAYLVAGEDYAQAYRRAFNNERVERLTPVAVATTVLRWSGSVLKKYSDRFDEFELPSNIKMQCVQGGADARLAALQRIVRAVVA